MPSLRSMERYFLAVMVSAIAVLVTSASLLVAGTSPHGVLLARVPAATVGSHILPQFRAPRKLADDAGQHGSR